MDHPHRYDAFLSYRRQEPDRTFVRDLLARLEKGGYTVAIDERDFAPNLPFLQEMERCIRESRFTLAVLSPGYRKSGNCEEEALICAVLDMGERQRRLLPLVIEKVEMPAWIYVITGIDFTAQDPVLDPYEKLMRTLGTPLRLSDPDHFQIHPRVGEVFAGRERELDDIEKNLLGEGRPVAICALQGMPGVGKSYLADRFYHLHTSRFPGGYQRLVLDPAGPDPTADSLLGELADRLKLQPDPVLVRERLLQPRTLLHVENVDSKPLAQAVAKLVAKLPNCPIVVTGRYQGLGIDAGWGRVEIRPLGEDDALDQLTQELGSQAREGEDAYRLLVHDLGFLPLAIHLAAGHLRAGRTIEGFLERLRTTGFALEPDDDADPALASRGRAILANTFNLSLELLREQLNRAGMAADRLLAGFHALSQAPASGFGASLGAAIADLSSSEFEELVVNASKLSVLEPVPAAERPDRAWRIHALLAELLQRRQVEEEERRAFDRMTEWFVSRLPMLPFGQEDEMGQRWNEVRAETDALISWLARVPPEDRVRVERAGSWHAINIGPFNAWALFCEEMLASSLEDKERSHSLWTLGWVYHLSGALDRALRAAEDKRELDRERGDERGTALAAGQIADILQARGQLDEALRIRQDEQLPVFEKIGDIRERAVTLGKIADILQARGQLDEALKIRQDELLPVFEKIGDIRSRAIALGQIADILQARGQLDEALRIRQDELLPVFEKIGDIRERAVTLGRIADIFRARGQLDEALKIRQDELLPVFEKIGDIRERAVTLGRIADIFQARGQLDKVFPLRQEELSIHLRLGAARDALITQVEIARTHLQKEEEGDREAAQHLLGQALEAAERLRIPEADWIREILQGIEDPEGGPE
jgi:tetratricopeptide (TPR) repeat protein